MSKNKAKKTKKSKSKSKRKKTNRKVRKTKTYGKTLFDSDRKLTNSLLVWITKAKDEKEDEIMRLDKKEDIKIEKPKSNSKKEIFRKRIMESRQLRKPGNMLTYPKMNRIQPRINYIKPVRMIKN